MTGHITGDSRKRNADQTPRMTPGESTDSGRVAELLLSVKWPDGGLDGMPTRKVAGMLAEAILASDWLADVVAQAKAEAVAGFVEWVATQRAFNGAGDTGQALYDYGLNAVLPKWALQFIEVTS